MTPLVDVVMVILIFLMCTGSFGGIEKYLESHAGYQSGNASQAPLPPNFIAPTTITIYVDIDPQSAKAAAAVDNGATLLRYVATVDGTPYTSFAGLSERLKRMADSPAFKEKANAVVVIRPELKVLHRQLIDVYQAANSAGFSKIAFAPPR